jgi:WD40 repeat protein/serine/threonine protein kinase/DNA-binding SARP family transcriptional activator
MAHLTIRLLGPFQVTLNEQPITGFESDKVRALLAYLAVEAGRPHRREALAGLLWPEMPERTARANLRYALANLRQAIGDHDAAPPFLHITRQTLQFNRNSDAWVDADEFAFLVAEGEVRQQAILQLEQAVALFRGEFLEGFTLRDSAAFEEWVLLHREHLARLRLAALHRLTAYHEAQGAYETALRYAWEQVEIEPWQEDAHQQVMNLLVTTGQRTAALAQYETLRQALQQELSVDPSPETEELYRRILSGEVAPEAEALRDQIVRGYDLMECIGEGNAGAVYRAYQPILGREVAIKVILPRYANRPEFIRRFEVEAQLVARLEHLHIVPLYDYWREPDGAYLVMRLFQAGSLKDSLAQGSWEPKVVARTLDQIASALAAAHGQGVVHQDIKPANILLDEGGNAYLTDFGIVRDVTAPLDPAAPETTTASPEYAAPEQWQGGPISPLADLYSLGVVLYEMLTGKHPFLELSPDELRQKHLFETLPSVCALRPELPPVIDQVVQQATAKNPQDRFPDALMLADAFRQSLAIPSAVPSRAEPWNPYKGLRYFREADAPDFFGRDALIRHLLARLEGETRFLAVVGPSGSGKSSAVHAGLIPALRRGALPSSEGWFIVTMQPGSNPFERLEEALLRVASEPPQDLLGQLRGDERGLLRAVEMIASGEEDELVLVVDQFEEVFTLVVDEGERAHFLASLLAAVSEPGSRLRLVVTLRADHYDRPLQYAGFGELVKGHTEVVLPLSPEEREQAIVGPAERVGVTLEPGLVVAIVADVMEQPGALPLLQYTLTELFESREERELTLQAYQALGGVLGSLGRRAEGLYGNLDEAGQEATRQLFLRLVTLHEGLEVGRRRVLRPDLAVIAEDRDVADAAIDVFGRHRLLSFDRDPATRIPTVEVAHEALFREWGRLRAWLDENRDNLRSHQRLVAAAAEWHKAGREPGFLLRGTRLDQFKAWADTTDLALSQVERNYLHTSLAERRERQAEEAARQAREKALERRSRNVLRTLVVVLLLATVGALGLAAIARDAQNVAEGEALARATQQAVAVAEAGARATQQAIAEMEAEARATQQAIAEEQARIATARELAMAALNDLDVDPERSILLAMQAVTTTYALDQTVLREAEEALHWAVHASRVVRIVPQGRAEAFSPDGTRFATIGEDHTATVWDAVSGEALFTLLGHSDAVFKVIFSPDETRLASTSFDGTARIWDAETGEELLVLEGHTAALISPAFSPDGTRLATTSLDGTARVWDISTTLNAGSVSGEELLTLPHSGLTGGVAFSPDGTRLAVADHDAFVARVWDLASGEELVTLTGHTDNVNDVAFSPDGKRLATASTDLTAKVWDATTGEELLTLEGHDAFVFGVDWSLDGSRIATGSEDGTANVWDATAGKDLLTLAGHSAGIGNVAFSQDGQYLLTDSEDGTARVWDITPEGSRELLTLAGHSDVAFRVAYSPDGTRLATASFDGTAKMWDPVTGEELLTLAGHSGLIYDIAFSPDGTRLATTSFDGTAKIWDLLLGEELLTLMGHSGPVIGVDWSPDGAWLATGSEDGTAKVWDLEASAAAATGEALVTMEGHLGDIWSDVFGVAFSPDGSLLATASWDETAKVWDAETGRALLTLEGHTERLNRVAFSPDGTRLATVSFDGTAKVWDLLSGEAMLTLTGHAGIVWDVAFSPDGTRLATVGFDNTTRLWDASTGQELLVLTGNEQNTAGVAFSPDGTRLAASGGDGTARIYVLPIEDLMALARTRVTRALTHEECRQYLHLDQCP